ncbi:MAG: hypothetical protein RJB38_2246 [Pseudomonadota bacterium]|jgi:hypothetical protein
MSVMVLGLGFGADTQAGVVPWPGAPTNPNDKATVIAVEDDAVVQAFNQAESLADNRARQLVLTKSAMALRQNFLPWQVSVSANGGNGEDITLDGLNLVFDTRVLASDRRTLLDLYRDTLSFWSGVSKGKVYTNIWSRKENWFNSDGPVAVQGSNNSVVASATVYENLWAKNPGVLLISGMIFDWMDLIGFKIVCDSSGLCHIDGWPYKSLAAVVSWTQVNKSPSGASIHFFKRGLSAEQAEAMVMRIRSTPNPTFKVKDIEQNLNIVDFRTNAALNFVPDRTYSSSFQLEKPPSASAPQTYTLHLWMNASKIDMPCFYSQFCIPYP